LIKLARLPTHLTPQLPQQNTTALHGRQAMPYVVQRPYVSRTYKPLPVPSHVLFLCIDAPATAVS
jgi:hypothetical protein